MARSEFRWWRRRRDADDAPYSRVTELDLLIPARYPMGPQQDRGHQREAVRQLVGGLAPKAIDEGTGEVLHNLINAWADEALALVDAEHQERQTVADHLIGVAAEKFAGLRVRYESAQAEHEHAAAAFAEVQARLLARSAPAAETGKETAR